MSFPEIIYTFIKSLQFYEFKVHSHVPSKKTAPEKTRIELLATLELHIPIQIV